MQYTLNIFFMSLFDLNFRFNNLFEVLSITFLFVDLAIKFCILPISTKISKFTLAGLILINLQLSAFSIAFCLSISHSISRVLCPNSSTSIASLYFENMHQFYSLKHCVEILYFQPKIHI